MARHLPYRWGGRREDRDLLFHAFGHTPGVHTLSPFLTINSQTEEPYLRYKGGDASLSGWSKWGYGGDLSYVSGAAPDFQQLGPGVGNLDYGVRFNEGAYFKDTSSSYQITTEDFVIEIIGKLQFSASSKWNFGTYLSGNGGILFGIAAGTTQLRIYCADGSTTKYVDTILGSESYYHALVGCNRDEASTNGLTMFLNGAYVDGEDASAVGNMSGAPFCIGASGDYAFYHSVSAVYYLSLWKKTDWLAGGAGGVAELAAISAERFYRWSGTWPTKAVGSWAPTVATRAFGAYLEHQDVASPYTKRIYQVGSEHLRVQRAMPGGVPIIGYRPEPQTTNLITESEDLATTWTPTRCSISQDAIDTPDGDGRTVVDGIIANTDNDTHYVEIAPGFDDGESHWISFYAKAGDVDWLKIEDVSSGFYAYIDLANGVIGDTYATNPGIDAYIEGDFVRVVVSYVLSAAEAIRIYPAYADEDDDFAGDGSTVSIYLWGVQVEVGDYFTSLINTDGATATRLADSLRYKGDDGNIPVGPGRMTFKILFPEPRVAHNAYYPFVTLSDGGSEDDFISVLFSKSEFAFIAVLSAATGGDVGQSYVGGDPRDGDVHTVEIRWKTDYLAIAVDGVWGTPDTSVDIPDDLDRIDIGAADGTVSPGYIISDLKIMKW